MIWLDWPLVLRRDLALPNLCRSRPRTFLVTGCRIFRVERLIPTDKER